MVKGKVYRHHREGDGAGGANGARPVRMRGGRPPRKTRGGGRSPRDETAGARRFEGLAIQAAGARRAPPRLRVRQLRLPRALGRYGHPINAKRPRPRATPPTKSRQPSDFLTAVLLHELDQLVRLERLAEVVGRAHLRALLVTADMLSSQ